MRGLTIYSTILMCVLFVFFGVIYWPVLENFTTQQPTNSIQKEIEDFRLAENYYRKARFEDALEILSRYENTMISKSEMGNEWIGLLVKISEKTLDIPQLMKIHEYSPELFANNEKASILVATELLIKGQDEAYRALRNKWEAEMIHTGFWTVLDADYLLSQGKYNEAYRLLDESQMDGKDEIERLIRLALLNAAENPQISLNFLNLANQLDIGAVDVYLYQAKLLEKTAGRDAAYEVYKKAVQQNPKSLFLSDQLANYYLGRHEYVKAIQTWKNALNVSSQESDLAHEEILLKTIFFDRMLHGKTQDWNKYHFSNGLLKPLISYLLALNPGEFVDNEAFSNLKLKKDYTENVQVVYWLNLLDALKNQDYDQAMNMIHSNPFEAVSYNTELEFAIIQAINFKKTGSLLPTDLIEHHHSDNQLLTSLNSGNFLSYDMEALLRSDEAYSAIFLSFGWNEPAIALHKLQYIPDNFPDFVALDLTKALRSYQGERAALEFASKQKTTVNLAEQIQEMNARVALQEGNQKLAEKIYETIADNSFEAKSYLARKAFRERDFSKAQLLTEEMLKKYPDNQLLLENLKKIQQKNV
jgi:predicted Zn-dependent protease